MVFTLSGIHSGCSSAHNRSVGTTHLPRDAFLFITNTFLIRACQPSSGECKDVGAATVSGSGFLIASHGNQSYGITAGHLCIQGPPPGAIFEDGSTPQVLQRIEVLSLNSVIPISAQVLNIDASLDLCLLQISSPARQVIELSPEPPKRGERAFTMAAPLGTFDSAGGMLLTFDGYYSGATLANPLAAYGSQPTLFDAYTIPSQHGSSGSPIMNERGQLIGVTSMALTRFENMCLSPNYMG